MPYPLIINPEAKLDLKQTTQWYNNQHPGLGYDFLECVEGVFTRIRRTPEIHAIAHKTARLTLVKRFPYVVCYLFENETVYVIAVFHGHRDPRSWKDRI